MVNVLESQSERSRLADRFLADNGWSSAKRMPLAGDASFRRYERVYLDGRQAVLMDAPPEQEDIRPFMRVAGHLHGCGLSAPEMFAADPRHGFLLLEDLGDSLYTRLLQQDAALEERLYLAAADVLLELCSSAALAGQADIASYDHALLMREAALFSDWFLPAVMDKEAAREQGRAYLSLWDRLLESLPASDPVLVLRDFHADNLLWLPDRAGTKRVGLLDFQDAVMGHPAYDMVSFLEDARRDVSPATVERVLDHYLAQVKTDREEFMAAYALLGAQRNCKIIGIFTRLSVRDHKHHYLSYLPRIWKHLENDLRHPLLAPLKQWMDKQRLPA